jgi:hypothetical protein
MATRTALVAPEPPAINEAMLMPIAAGITEVVRPTDHLQSYYCYAEAQELPITPQCRRAAKNPAARGRCGIGCRCAPWLNWQMCINPLGRIIQSGASRAIKYRESHHLNTSGLTASLQRCNIQINNSE